PSATSAFCPFARSVQRSGGIPLAGGATVPPVVPFVSPEIGIGDEIGTPLFTVAARRLNHKPRTIAPAAATRSQTGNGPSFLFIYAPILGIIIGPGGGSETSGGVVSPVVVHPLPIASFAAGGRLRFD